MSSGETTFSGSSRFKSSYDRNFLSPPNCSNRSITSSLSFSSLIATFIFLLLLGSRPQGTYCSCHFVDRSSAVEESIHEITIKKSVKPSRETQINSLESQFLPNAP